MKTFHDRTIGHRKNRRGPEPYRSAAVFAFAAAVFLLFGCSGQKVELRLKASLDGRAAAGAAVSIDGEERGFTDAAGALSDVLSRRPGSEVELVVSREAPGYRTRPWKKVFTVKKQRGAAVYSFEAEIPAVKYVTVSVTDQGSPVGNAVVRADGVECGKTGPDGLFVYDYRDPDGHRADFTIMKPGYALWRWSGALEPGRRIDAPISRQATITVSALMDDYGRPRGIPGVAVTVNGAPAGQTDDRGMFTWPYGGAPGAKAVVVLSAPGFIPSSWSASAVMEGDVRIGRYFYPSLPRPVRTAVYHFTGNTPGADLSEVRARIVASLSARLFSHACVREVPAARIYDALDRAGLTMEDITAPGRRETALGHIADMIVTGSVSRDGEGLLVETRLYTSGGELLLSKLSRLGSVDDISDAARDIAAALLDRLPVEGTVTGIDGERCRINLGTSGCRIAQGEKLVLLAPRKEETGRIAGYREIGFLRIDAAGEEGSWATVERMDRGEKAAVGDRVYYRKTQEPAGEEEGVSFLLTARGGTDADAPPLAGVNVYVDDAWAGTTGPDGSAEFPVPLGRTFTLLLYRPGYRSVADRFAVGQSGEAKEYGLAPSTALFRIDSRPQRADVFVDGRKIGRTPIPDGRLVRLGFHRVRVAAGGGFRAWEGVMEFARQEENLTAGRKIILHRDVLGMGEKAEQSGDIDAALRVYGTAKQGHPDYAAARLRMARILLDDKGDFDGAIRIFEEALPAANSGRREIGRFPLAYADLGRACYEKGAGLAGKDPAEAVRFLDRAIGDLETAKRSMQSFPLGPCEEVLRNVYYYRALAYDALYVVTRKPEDLRSADRAWSDYLGSFPRGPEGRGEFERRRARTPAGNGRP